MDEAVMNKVVSPKLVPFGHDALKVLTLNFYIMFLHLIKKTEN